jgi:hypothetical protein
MNSEQLEFAIRSNPADVVTVLSGASEKERRAASTVALRWHKALWADILAPSINGLSRDILWKTLPLALLGTASLTELKTTKVHIVTDHEPALEILRCRRPEWLQGWADWALSANFRAWPFLRALEREALIVRPAGEHYVMGLIAAAARHGAYRLLDSDPDLLNCVPELFEVEGAGECSLAAFDKYSHGDTQWSSALLRLSQEGRVSRERLLDDSLSALNRGFAAFRAGWFSRFHEALKPTLPERIATLPKVYPLLGSPVPATVSFALKILTQRAILQALDTERLLAALGPVWMLAQKGPVMSALKLLAHTPPGPPWLPHLTQAATHPAAEVQKEALRLLRKASPQPEGSWRQRWVALAPSLEPSVQGDWCLWLEVRPETPSTVSELSSDKRDDAFAKTEVSAGLLGVRPEPWTPKPVAELYGQSPAAVKPCQSVDEVFELATSLVEELHPPIEIERLLDGLTRFGGRDSPRKPALNKRLRRLLEVEGVKGDLAALLAHWLGDDQAPAVPVSQPWHLETFLKLRLEEIRSALSAKKGPPQGLHSLPEDESGSLSAKTLAQRLRQQPEPLRWDFTQALLRLRPGDSSWLAEDFQGISGQAVQALAWAVGAPGKKPLLFAVAEWWTAAQNIRDADQPLPWGFEVKVSSHTHAGKTYHHRAFALVLPSSGPDAVVWTDRTQDRHSLAWQALICPARTERFQLLGIPEIANNIDWWEADWSDRVYLETLLDATRPWGRTSTFLAALGMACKEAGQRGIAIDAVGQALQRGLLSPSLLGQVMAEALSTGMLTTKRWAASFQELRRFAPLEALFEALQSLLATADETAAIKPLLEPLLEIALSLNNPIRDERARAALGALGQGGKAGKQAAALLALAATIGSDQSRPKQ